MAKELDLSEFGGAPQLDLTEFSEPQPKGAGAFRRVADTGLALAKGVVGVPEAAVGAANLVTKGRAGKLVEKAGVRFKDAKDVLTGFQSDEQHAADAEVAKADGFVPTLGAMVRNPSTIANAAAESAPSMILGGAAARGIMRAAPEVGGIAAGAAGEGVVAAGQNTEQVRQEDPNGLITGKQAAILGASGLATGGISLASGNLANRMGLGDVQTMLATGKLGTVGAEAGKTAAKKGIFRKVGEGALVEGVGQELPQSAQEQAAQNIAQGKPVGEGVGAAAAQGMLVGGLTGAGGAGLSALAGPDQVATDPPPAPGAPPAPAATPPAAPAGLPPIDPNAIAEPGQTAPGMGYDPNAVTLDTLPTSGDLPVIHPSAGPLSAAASLLAGPDGVIHAPLPVLDEKALVETAGSKSGKVQPGPDKAQPAPESNQVGTSATPPAPQSVPPVSGKSALSTPAPSPGAADPTRAESSGKSPTGSAPRAPDAQQPSQPAPASETAGPVAAGQSKSKAHPEQTEAPGTVSPGDPNQKPSEQASQPPAKAPIVPREASTTKEKASAPETAEAIQGPPQRRQEPAAQGTAPVPAGGAATEPAAAPAVENPAQGATPAGPAVIDTAAHAAATSPRNDLPEPTDAQKKAGNYPKGHVKLSGMDLSIENPAESVRSGTDKGGKAWTNTLQHHYGYIKGTIGNDKDHVDTFVKPDTPLDYAGTVFVVDQVNPDTGKFDEHKVMIGFDNLVQARAAYQANYAKGWKGLNAIAAMPMAEFKTWVYDGPKNKPLVPIAQSGSPQAGKSPSASAADVAPRTSVATPAKPVPPVSTGQQGQSERTGQTVQPSPDGTSAPADPAAGKWYGTQEKAAEKLAALGLADTHEVVRDGMRFELRKKAAQPQVSIDKALDAVHFLVNNAIDQRTKGYIPIDQLKFNAAVAQAKAAGVKVTTHPPGSSGTVVWTFEKPDGSTYSAYQEKSGRGTWIAHPAKKAPAADEQKGPYAQWRDSNPVQRRELLRAAGYTDADQARVLSGTDWGQLTDPVRRALSGPATKKPATPQLPGPFEGTPGVSYGLPTFASNGARGGPKVIVNKLGPDGLTDAERAAGKKPYNDPVPEPKGKPTDELKEREKAAKAKMLGAAAKLANLLSKNTRANITPEQEQAMLPIVIELFEGAMDLGYVKFKQAARYVREFIAGAIDQDAADSIPIDTLQGAYIATARRHKDKPITSKADVIAVESVDELTDDLDVQDAVPIPNATNYDASNLDEPAGRDGWAEVGYIEGINRVAYRVDAREIRQSNKGVSKAIRQIRIYDDNRASYMAVWEWDSAKLEDEVFEGLRINQAVFHYSLTSETEEAFGADASDGDALWARYGKQIVGDIEQERTFDRAALPAPPADSGGLETTREKADTATNGGPNGNENTQPGVASGDPRPVPDAQGGRGALAQQGAAPVNPGDVEAREPTNVGEPAAGDAGRAPGVRPASEDVGSPGGTDAVGPAGDGRKGAGGKGKPATRARSRSGSRANPAVVDPDTVSPANTGPGDFVIDDPLKIVGGGQVARFDKNKAAIEMRNMLVEAGRAPTREEQAVLAGYTGWGSFGQELFQGSWAKPAPKPAWEARDQWLRENLGQKEWEGLQTSIINAHFTDPPTVLAMWDMVRKMGFTGGRTLEPSIGIGNFYGMMPVDMVGRSQRAGIELDPVTGSMAQMLYPNANIQIKGYEESKTPDNFYDLVIGNWPFFEHGPADRRYNRLSPTLHDYFFLKALDQTRPGGLVVGITSKGTMDKKGIGARMEMARKGELVAAFRLPTGAFAEYAGTAVVTDIIILRKRDKPLGIVAGEGWIEVKDHPTREGTAVPVNEYFHTHPDHVIGEIDFGHGTTTFRPGLIVHRPDNMMEQLRRIAELVPEGAFHADQTAKHISYVANHTKDRTNSLVDTPQGLFVVHGEHMAPAGEILKYELKDPKATQKRVNELKALVKMRQLYGALIDAERSAKGADTQRTALRQAYEAFTKANGPMSKSFGLQYLRKLDDPFYPSLAALEIGIPDANGKVSYRPAKILSESTMRGARAIESPSVTDAFVLARNESVNPPITRIAEISGKPEVEVRKVLVESGAGYEMPNGDFAPADVYLSGNVRAKLREAKAAVEAGNKAVERNVEALQKVVPADIPYYKIETQMGATWVPPSAYADFVGHMLGLSDTREIQVGFDAGSWKVDFPSSYNHRAEARSGYGSPHVSFKRMVRAAIANQVLNIQEKDENGAKVDVMVMGDDGQMVKATDIVNGKIADMRLNFGEWLWSDPTRRTALEKEYNEVRNAYATPQFDGSFLGFQGMALTLGSGPFNLREHQVNAIWRGLVTRKSLNAHEVGTGKTFTMGGIAVESRRYGIAKKPLLFAHNANSKSVAHEIQMMYPSAKVLYVDNLSTENLKTRMMQIANDDWDVIVMPHSIIDRIGFKEETLMSMAQEELSDLEQAAEEAASEDGVSISSDMWENEEELNKLRSVTAKQLVKQRLKILTTIHKLAQQGSREDSVAFEDMGVDMLLVDEAHEFKKPPIATKMKLKGLQTATSNRSISMMFLTKYVRSMHDGGNVHLFTGTPITNTMTEVFHMMRYMMQEEMKDVALADWDGWFGSFAREVNDVELTSTGEYEAVTRLQSFINVPELRRMIGQYMDVVFSDDMPEMKPRAVNGKLLSDKTLTESERAHLLNGRTEGAKDRPYKKVVNESSDMSPDQLQVFAEVQQYANTWKNMSKRDRKDAMADGAPESPLIHDGIAGKASFDTRLVEAIANAGKEGSAEMEPHPDSKAARTIKNLLEIYRGHGQAAQVVFMSQGMAKRVTRREGPRGMKRDVTHPAFSTMYDMIERLVAAGVPREQIAAVDGNTSKDKRKEVADAMNTGKIRIVFGSTGSLGVGVNMQRNLRAMHHMDAPWMPGDLEQRNGRGHRQGNQWNTVLEYRYITDRLDGKRWQTLARKQKFITDFMKSKGDVRVIEGDVASEDQDDILSTFSEAAGDPRILMREKFKKNLEQLRSRERLHGIAQSDAAGDVKSAQRDIANYEKFLADVKESGTVERLTALMDKQRGDGFTMTIADKPVTTRADAAAAITAYVAEMRIGDDSVVGSYGDLTLHAEWDKLSPSPNLYVKVGGQTVESNGPSLASLETGLRQLRDTAESKWTSLIERAKERMAHAKSVAAEPFHLADKLQKTQQQLDDLERDISMNPVAPPYWLRNGAAIDTEVYRDGKPFTVTGHRWTNDGWYVVAADERGDVNIPYMEAMDNQGMPLYEEHEFTQPTVTAQNAAASQAINAQPAADDGEVSFNTKDDAPFYSALSREIGAINAKAQAGPGWAMNIAGLVKAGKVKQDEVNWTGVLDWLRLQEGRVTKDQVSAYLDANGVQVQETVLGDADYGEVESWWNDEGGANEETPFGDLTEQEQADAAARYTEEVGQYSEGDRQTTKYGQYQLPGGTNYREVLLTLPQKETRTQDWVTMSPDGSPFGVHETEDKAKAVAERIGGTYEAGESVGWEPSKFNSSHWDQSNVIAHLRVNDRTDADGKKVLFVEEIQSDWGQAGKKQGFDAITPKFVPQVAPGERRALIVAMTEAFRDKLVAAGVDSATATTVAEKTGHDVLSRTTGMVAEYQDLLAREDSDRQAERASKIVGIPSAPFVTKTDAWLSLALKRIVKMAADGGYDRVAFVNGEQSAERYDLSKQVRSIVWTGRGNDTEKRVTITPNDGNDIEFMVQPDGAVGAMGRGSIGNEFDGKRLDDIVGKDVAERIMGDPYGDMRGNGLKVGGEGMKAFYDKIVPNTLKDVLKKVGGGAMETMPLDVKGRLLDSVRYEGPEYTSAQLVHSSMRQKIDNAAQENQLRAVANAIRAGDTFAVAMADHGSLALARKLGGNLIYRQAEPDNQVAFTVTPAMREKAGGGLPMFAQSAYTPANGQQQSTADFGPDAASNVETLNRSIARFLGSSGTAARPYQARRLRDHAALQGLASAFGGTVQGFRVDPTLLGKQRESYGFFNGVYTAGTIFINEDSQRPHLAILGHETAHQLAKTDPIRYQQLVAAIRPYIDPAKYPAFARTAVGRENANNPDKLREEFVGEVLSDGFMNRDFWRAVGKSNPSLLQRIVRMVGQLLNTALAKMGYTNRTEQYLTDFNKVMQVAGEVMGEYGLKPPAVATGGLSFNRGTNAPVVTNNDVAGNSQGGRSAGDNTPSVAKLQSQLAAVEAKFEPLRGNPGAYEGQQWSAIAAEAASIRRQLFALTGDAYGKPKVKTARPSDDALNAQYASPDDVPPVVRRWVQQHANTLTSDATDAVRWGRIADTLKDDRYPAGDLTIYRAVANGDEIRPGDWVTTERKYAEQHLSRYLNGKGLVLEESVDGRDVLTSPTGNSEEAIFAPRNLSGPVSNESIAPDSGGAMSFNTMDGAQTLRSVTDRLMEATSPIGTVSLWDKTVGTQYNKSTKDADFKRVFDGFYQQTDDTAHYAIEAERHAPDVLMRLEGLGDIWKGLMQSGAKQKADLAAVSKALFANIEGEEGIKQVEYDDRNLRDLFNLNPRQIEMYRQVRKAVNTSIERLAQTYAAQFGQQQGMDIDRLKNMSLEDTVASVKGKIRDDLNEAVAKAKLRASVAMEDRGKLTPEQTRAAENALAAQVLALNKAADALTKRLDLMQEHASFLQENAYMPALRFGEYAVTVTQEDGDGKAETLHFEMFESQTAANLAAMRLRKEYPDAQVSKSVLNKDQYEMFKGVSPETVALFAKFTGVDKNEAVQNYIALAKSSRSVLMRQLKRKGVAGFSQDATRVLASFVTSNARQSAINMNQGAISDALASKSLARKGDVQREAQKLAQYMNNPLEEARRLRGFMFAHFMGGSVASALVNMTQPVMQTAPYLSQFAGAKTPGIMLSSARMAASGKIADTELRDAAKRAAEDGITEPHEIHQLMADAGSSGLGNNLRWRAAIKAWGSFFSLAEAYNRRVTFLAAYQVAKLQNKSDPYEFARIAVIETQGLYGKVNRPNWARGAVGATLFTFKQFSIAYIEFIRRLPPKQKLLALGILVLAAGLQGLPFAEDVEDLIDTIGQSLGYNTNSKKALRKFLVDNLGSDLGAIVDSGIFTQTNVDVQGRLGMGNLIPGTAIFKPSETNKARTMSEVVGPLGGILMSAQNALGALQRGDYTGAAKEMTPVAGKNFLKGLDMATSGIYKDTRGYKVADVTAAESFMKMLGLQPATIAEKTRRISEQWQDKSMVTMMEAMIADSWAQGVAEKDPDMVAKARKTLVEWNERNPDSRIQIGFAQIRRRVQQINQTREQRFVKTVPKELRAGVARELAQ